ncbi:isoprenylcysteine carboxyl methyltransferase family protein [Mycobacterium sp. ITM-2016-00316]|uniref:isoprenylcysteine carboxyl methyltransferase family protein n=1 Tax=Mycobacterium sp. ITM-2016-00316 TaxID=2099695 RepID=UPI000CFA2BBF|nr:isoprenylcysteine carboxyl methyltransferase family protein [Mycobacterium sp. ITM-2016-00316]WNG81429.1 isoprenylcysteine carboxyl methyltransferase family protein [Mycobacterium sp. ITM-2016-00316]
MYYLFIVLIGLERLVELAVSRRNANWSFARGGREFGQGHYPVMVAMHSALLLSCIAEVAFAHRPFIPALGWPMVAVVAASTVVRWWCVATLGKHWNPRLIIVPGAELVRSGPYRWIHHPNYTAVAVEVAALPLVHSAWLTAIVFTIANAAVLRVRISAENLALGYA